MSEEANDHSENISASESIAKAHAGIFNTIDLLEGDMEWDDVVENMSNIFETHNDMLIGMGMASFAATMVRQLAEVTGRSSSDVMNIIINNSTLLEELGDNE